MTEIKRDEAKFYLKEGMHVVYKGNKCSFPYATYDAIVVKTTDRFAVMKFKVRKETANTMFFAGPEHWVEHCISFNEIGIDNFIYYNGEN